MMPDEHPDKIPVLSLSSSARTQGTESDYTARTKSTSPVPPSCLRNILRSMLGPVVIAASNDDDFTSTVAGPILIP